MLENLSSAEEKEDVSYEPIEDSLETLSIAFDTCIELPYEAEPIEANEDVIEEFSDLPNESYDPEFEPREELIVASSLAVTEHLEAKPEEEVIELDDETQEPDSVEETAQFSVMQTEENETAKFITLDTTAEPKSGDLASPQEEEAPFTVLQETKPLPPVTNAETLSTQKPNRNEEVDLDENPYFQKKRLNFRWTKLIVPTITLVVVLGLFVSIFLILHMFK
ncbi:MAG: hypothetical protein K2N65_05065 [Anaeroplasmataceae bacterium]|nr:hypothetical protein [Anaeroplasmataceae bacterium]